MKNETLNLNFEDTPATGRTLPIAGRPFSLVMEELAKEHNGFVRIVR